MKISHWIADLITGSALTRAERDIELLRGSVTQSVAAIHLCENGKRRLEVEIERLKELSKLLSYDNTNGWSNSERFEVALRTIVAMPTPKANATVRRMAAVAREALK